MEASAEDNDTEPSAEDNDTEPSAEDNDTEPSAEDNDTEASAEDNDTEASAERSDTEASAERSDTEASAERSDTEAPMIETIGVSKSFGTTPAVKDVTMSVSPGEVVGLLGANGAGKTTLIRLVLGLIRPSTGSIRLLGQAPSRHGRQRVGYVPQNLGLYTDLTVAENLSFVANAFQVVAGPLPAELAAVSDRLVGKLPLGLRRRVAFEAARSHSPQILILDEPTSGVGPLGRARLWESIDRAASEGVGVLVSTHYMAEAEECDRVVVMASGAVVADGTTASLRGTVPAVAVSSGDWRGAYHALDEAGLAVMLAGGTVRVADASEESIRKILRDAGLETTIEVVPSTLDEAFVALARR